MRVRMPGSRRIRSGILAIFCLLIPVVTSGQTPLPPGVEQVLAAPEYKHTLWGLLVVDVATGTTVYELNPDKLFTPASVTKLFSVAAALDGLGADYRFTTPVVQRGEIDAAGELRGDLVLLASGDLSMGGRTLPDGTIAFTNNDHTYANGGDKGELTAPDPLAGLNELARQIAAAGVKRVHGDVLVDDRLFDKETSTGSGPARVNPILINDNLIDLTITPGELGKPAKITVRPATSLIRVDCRLETAAEGTPLATTIRATAPYDLIVGGKIAVGNKPVVRVYEVPNAASFARSLFIEALERAGVTLEASPLVEQGEGALTLPREAYAKLPPVAQLSSPPFSESAKLVLKVSHNLHASTLPMLLASTKNKRTLADGLALQHDFLARVGVDVETISFGGGAGGSQADCVTPRATVQLLQGMRNHPAAQAYRGALPILGVDGTLSETVPVDSPARGKVFAKTGTYYWDNTLNKRYLLTSKALAGYMTTAKNRELAFAVFLNRAHIAKSSDTALAGKALGKICEAIYLEQ